MASTVIKMNHYIYLHNHPSLFLLPHLKWRLLKLLPLPQQQLRCHRLRGRSSLSKVLPLTFRRHIQLKIIINLNERVTQFSRLAHLSCFANTLFVALFEPRNVGHALSVLSWVSAMHQEL
jgi:hypothetical protein